MQLDFCKSVTEEYYEKIYAYCYAQLKNRADAEDCVQSTFLTMLTANLKDDGGNILVWLIETAKRKSFEIRRQRRRAVPVEVLEIPDTEVPTFEVEESGRLREILTEEELQLLVDYYERVDDREALATRLGISIDALRHRVTRLKSKIQRLY